MLETAIQSSDKIGGKRETRLATSVISQLRREIKKEFCLFAIKTLRLFSTGRDTNVGLNGNKEIEEWQTHT